MSGVKLATAYYELVPSMAGAQGDITRQFTGVGADASKGFGGSFIAGAKKFAGPLAAVFAAVKVKDFLGDALGEARESQKVGALTESIIKSTGGAAKVSAGQVGELASAISRKSGIDDEAIQSGSNLLLTFKNVKNEVGSGNKIFDRATQSAVDLSAAGFGSVESSSKMLGKALNDPIKGISALGRAGVTFTEDQKAMIEGMVASGDVLGAQKIILGEVESQVGGAAEASATAGEKLAVAWGNFKENIGTALLPLIDKGMAFLTDTVIPALTDLGPKLSAGADVVRDFFARFSSGGGEAGAKLEQFRTFLASTWESVKSIFTSGVTIVQNLWRLFGDNILGYAKSAFENIMQVVRGAFTFVQGIFNFFAGLLTGDWSRMWEGIKQILSGAWSVITGLVEAAWNTVQFVFSNAGVILGQIFSGIWEGIKALAAAGLQGLIDIVTGLPGRLGALVGLFIDVGKSLMQGFLDGLAKAGGFVKDFASGVWNAVKDLINNGIDKINAALEFTINLPAGLGSFSINPKNIPHLAKGGVVTKPTLALIGEAGPEVVMPLSSPNAPDWVRNGPGGGGGGAQITVNPSAPIDEVSLAEIVLRKLQFATAGVGA